MAKMQQFPIFFGLKLCYNLFLLLPYNVSVYGEHFSVWSHLPSIPGQGRSMEDVWTHLNILSRYNPPEENVSWPVIILYFSSVLSNIQGTFCLLHSCGCLGKQQN